MLGKPLSNHYLAIIVNDESVCRSLGRLLRTVGYQAVTYPSAEAFLDDLKRPRFDCLILGLQLQGISGLELSHRLAAVNDGTPVVFITDQEEPAELASLEATGCAGHFCTTHPCAEILEVIDQIIQPNGSSRPNPTPT